MTAAAAAAAAAAAHAALAVAVFHHHHRDSIPYEAFDVLDASEGLPLKLSVVSIRGIASEGAKSKIGPLGRVAPPSQQRCWEGRD